MALPEWAQEEGFVQNGDIRLHYYASGPADGEPVLLYHGFPQFSYLWRYHLPKLAEAGYRVVAPDLRGYGQSDNPEGVENYRMQELVGDIGAVYKHFGWRSANIVAHDWGGAVSWLFVTFYPQMVKRFVAVDIPHPTAFRAGLQTFDQIKSSWYIWFFMFEGYAEKVLKRNIGTFLNYIMLDDARAGTYSDADKEAYIEAFSRPGRLEAALNYYRANTTPANVYSDSSTDFPSIEPPTLLIYGSEDFAFAPVVWEQTANYCRNFRKEAIAGGSHWVLEEAPDQTLQLILGHLRSDK
jgi:epoxide hydrolase 4